MTTFEEQLRASLSHIYDIEHELGGGGMSRVFVATDKSLGRKIVIKVLSPELTADVNRGRFRREIQVAAQLQHPHIVTLLSAGEDDDMVYYTMPFIKGDSLKTTIQNGPMSVQSVTRVLYDVVDALAYAHENGVVHRDIKPANILRSGSHSLVTDFGVAKALNAARSGSPGMTSTGTAIGTPAYMSPEQLAGDPNADHRIDIYATGLLAYELLTGKSPFAGATPRQVLAAVLTQQPTPLNTVRPEVPQGLSDLVMACLTKEPEGRPASADEMLATLDLYVGSGEIRTREHRVPGSATLAMPTHNPSSHMKTPVSTPSMPAVVSGAIPVAAATPPETTAFTPERTTPVETEVVEEVAPKKGSKKFLIIGAGVLVPVIAVAIFLSQGSSPTPAPAPLPVATDSAAAPLAVPAAATPDSSAAAPKPAAVALSPDSQARVDSAKARAARAAAAKKLAAAAKADSLKKMAQAKVDSVQKKDAESDVERSARGAAGEMLANEAALKQFVSGASRVEGILKRQKGDLQTQINALQPYLDKRGLTYAQFKTISQQSGINIYDQYGRMVLEAVRRFANLAN